MSVRNSQGTWGKFTPEALLAMMGAGVASKSITTQAEYEAAVDAMSEADAIALLKGILKTGIWFGPNP